MMQMLRFFLRKMLKLASSIELKHLEVRNVAVRDLAGQLIDHPLMYSM